MGRGDARAVLGRPVDESCRRGGIQARVGGVAGCAQVKALGFEGYGSGASGRRRHGGDVDQDDLAERENGSCVNLMTFPYVC